MRGAHENYFLYIVEREFQTSHVSPFARARVCCDVNFRRGRWKRFPFVAVHFERVSAFLRSCRPQKSDDGWQSVSKNSSPAIAVAVGFIGDWVVSFSTPWDLVMVVIWKATRLGWKNTDNA